MSVEPSFIANASMATWKRSGSMRFTSPPSSHAFTCDGMCFQNITWYLAKSHLYQRCKAGFEFPQSDVADLERQREVFGDRLRLLGELRVRHLAQVEDRFVVAEVHRFQVRVPVQAEPALHRAVEVAHEPVGEEVGRRALVRDLEEELLAREHLVAVRPGHARHAELVEDGVQAAGGAAVAVNDDHALVARPELVKLVSQLGDDAVGVEVQQRRQAVDVDVPPPPDAHLLDLTPERTADNEGGLHPTGSSLGNFSTSTNVSLKSVRPDSSMYSRREGSSNATGRSRYDSSAIFAPSPAEFPTAMIRSTSTAGTSPMIFALSGFRYDPNDPARSTSSTSSTFTPRMSIRTLIPVAIEPFANCSSRTSFWVR